MDEDDQISQEELNEEQDSEQHQQSNSNIPDSGDIKNAKGKLDKVNKLAKGGKPPIPGTAGGTGGAGTASAGAGATSAVTAETGAMAGTAIAAEGTVVTGAATAPAWPFIIAAAIIIFLLMLLAFLIVGILSDGQIGHPNPDETPVSIIKTGPPEVPNNTNIIYRFIVTFDGVADDILIRDAIPKDTEYVASSPNAKTLDTNGDETSDVTLVKSVEWSLRDIQNTAPQSIFSLQTLSLTVRPLKSDVYIINQATSVLIGGSGNPSITPGESGYIPPSDDDCGGYYAADILKNSIHKNFGDPNCTMLANQRPEDKDRLHTHLTQLDPEYADYWFATIIPCESSFRANAFYTGSPSSGGAWGLLQMGASYAGDGPGPTPGLPPPIAGNNGEYDRGDVNWQLQASNAVNYNNLLRTIPDPITEDPNDSLEWQYWQCANGTHPE